MLSFGHRPLRWLLLSQGSGPYLLVAGSSAPGARAMAAACALGGARRRCRPRRLSRPELAPQGSAKGVMGRSVLGRALVFSRSTPPSSAAPLVARHDPFHELIEEGDGKSCVSVARAPDHAFSNQTVA